MSGHTPGPWTQTMGLVSDMAGYCTRESGHLAIVGDPTSHHATFGGSDHPMSIHDTERMAAANARLIAAAPDLLAALKKLIRRSDNGDIVEPGWYEIEEARAAVQRAEREEGARV